MSKLLVAYFSASGTTKKLAQKISDTINADLFEIEPEVPYTSKDLNWMDKTSRSTLEMKNPNSRPKIEKKLDNINDYDTILVGFPIWWYVAPTIINTFLESYSLDDKKVILFATSGGSKFGKTLENLIVSAPNTYFVEGGVLNPNMGKTEIELWIKQKMTE